MRLGYNRFLRMLLSDFRYELPESLIAQQPLEDRQASRMLMVNRQTQLIIDARFADLPAALREADVLVLNNTKVFPARLYGTTETGARVEIFLVREIEDRIWKVLARPGRRLKEGKKIVFNDELAAAVYRKNPDGTVNLAFETNERFEELIDQIGKTPLPPYIKRPQDAIDTDRERYQTVFAQNRGAIAAPTAGLHFTPVILEEIRRRGVTVVEITLHVGYGTFEPVRVSDLSEHRVAAERYEIDEAAAETLNNAKADNRRIVAVGTTTSRALESGIAENGRFAAGNFSTDLTITPDYKFKAVDAMLTNFHLPESSLLVLVSTFGGHELIMKAYRHAVESKYRFYSYGDCMLIE